MNVNPCVGNDGRFYRRLLLPGKVYHHRGRFRTKKAPLDKQTDGQNDIIVCLNHAPPPFFFFFSLPHQRIRGVGKFEREGGGRRNFLRMDSWGTPKREFQVELGEMKVKEKN
jgi:hypothetical protein